MCSESKAVTVLVTVVPEAGLGSKRQLSSLSCPAVVTLSLSSDQNLSSNLDSVVSSDLSRRLKFIVTVNVSKLQGKASMENSGCHGE